MPGFIPTLPVDGSGAPELNRWDGVTQEPSLAERIAGHVPYPGPPPAYDVENYARNRQYLLNLLASAVALTAQRASSTVTIAGVTVGNQRRITVNGTAVTYADTGTDTLASVTQKFVDLINDNATITSGVFAAAAVYVSAGVLTVFSLAPAGVGLIVSGSVLSGTGTITRSIVTVPDITIPAEIMATGSNCIVLGQSANDAGPQNNVRLVLDRATNALRAGGTTGTEWDTRAVNSVGLGWRADPRTQDSLAVGTQAVASVGQRAAAIGYQAAASAADAMAAGPSAAAGAAQATALGYSASATGTDSIAIGNASASDAQAVAVGTGCTSSGIGSFCSGGANSSANLRAGGDGSKAHGHVSATATGNTIIADGDGADAHGSIPAAVTAVYSGATASGDLSRAHGRGVTAFGDFSRAYGDGAVAAAYGETAHASGVFISGGFRQLGTAQDGVIRLLGQTVGSNVNLTFGNPASPVGEWDPPSGAYTIDVRVSALTSAGDRSMWTGQVAVYSAGGTVTIDAGGGNLTLLSDSAAIFLTPPQIAASGATLRLTARPPVGADPTRWFCEMRYARVSL